MEEVTTANIVQLIRKIPVKCKLIEKMLLVNEGTVQTFLSIIFQNPVYIKVIEQEERNNCFIRKANLVIKVNEIEHIICIAKSIIYKNTSGKYSGFYNGISEKKMGIGQLLAALQIPTERKLSKFDLTKDELIRTYLLYDIEKSINIEITESFQRKYFVSNAYIGKLKGDLTKIPNITKLEKTKKLREMVIRMGIQ